MNSTVVLAKKQIHQIHMLYTIMPEHNSTCSCYGLPDPNTRDVFCIKIPVQAGWQDLGHVYRFTGQLRFFKSVHSPNPVHKQIKINNPRIYGSFSWLLQISGVPVHITNKVSLDTALLERTQVIWRSYAKSVTASGSFYTAVDGTSIRADHVAPPDVQRHPEVADSRLNGDWRGRCRQAFYQASKARVSPIGEGRASGDGIGRSTSLAILRQASEALAAVPRTPRGQKRGRKGGRGGQMVHWVCRRIIKFARKERYFLRLLC